MRWVIPVSCSPILMAGNLAGLRSLDSVICFLFLSSWLLLAHLGVSVNRPKAYLCCSVFWGPLLSPQSSPVIRTRQAGNHSTSFIVCISGSAPEYSGDMPLFTLTLLGYVEVLLTQSCPTLCDPMDCSSPGSCLWNSPGKNTGVGCHFLLQGIFWNQGSNSGLLHCRWILYHLSHLRNTLIK